MAKEVEDLAASDGVGEGQSPNFFNSFRARLSFILITVNVQGGTITRSMHSASWELSLAYHLVTSSGHKQN